MGTCAGNTSDSGVVCARLESHAIVVVDDCDVVEGDES